MSKIRILPEHLANLIAAGEVVERPASVVKELLENSLDAGASRIEIEISGGGTRSIRIVDNGEGMDEDDVLLCFERHGTSKIIRAEQLAGVDTLGFRGEAIPSIAAVSKMTIISRTRDHNLGTSVVSHFGSIKSVMESGAPIGTTVEVQSLFGNTPARRKFLRTARTEIAHIDDAVKNIALSRPDIALLLRIDGRETLRLDSGATLEHRLAQLLNYHKGFITIHSGSPGPDGITISGLLVPPGNSAPVAGRLRLLVNGRSIKDRLLTHAVGEGLRSFLLKGHYPAGVICVNLPPTAVDVNVHPAKQEVRFREGNTIHQMVGDAVRQAMLQQQQLIRRNVFQSTDHQDQPVKPDAPLVESTIPPHSSGYAAKPPAKQPSPAHPGLFETREPVPVVTAIPPAAPVGTACANNTKPKSVRVENLVVIGSYRDLYIFCRNPDGLVVIDQHAAHERLLYEQLVRQYQSGKIASQQLLFPITIELTARQSQHVEDQFETLTAMGFSLRDFGGTTWVIAAVPALAGTIQPQHLLLDVLESFGNEQEKAGGGMIDTILATMACKAAVKAGDYLDDREIEALLRRMADADLFSHCPHGRPVVRTFNETELKKWFSRT